MTELKNQINSIERQIELLIAGDDTRQAIEELRETVNVLEPVVNSLKELFSIRKNCTENSHFFTIEFFESEQLQVLEKAKISYQNLAEASKEDITDLRQRGLVGEFRDALKQFNDVLKFSNDNTWKNSCDKLESGFMVTEAQLNSIENVPGHRSLVEEYKTTKDKFDKLSGNPSSNSDIVSSLESYAIDLSAIKDKIKFDMPDNVKKFYDRLHRHGDYPLDQCDEEVFDWLRENDGLKDLCIKFTVSR